MGPDRGRQPVGRADRRPQAEDPLPHVGVDALRRLLHRLELGARVIDAARGEQLLDREGNPLSQTLGPHEGGIIVLRDYVARYYGIDPDALTDFPPGGYTVEIFWSGDKKGLPLIGWSGTVLLQLDEGGSIIEVPAGWSTQMVNLEQVLKP